VSTGFGGGFAVVAAGGVVVGDVAVAVVVGKVGRADTCGLATRTLGAAVALAGPEATFFALRTSRSAGRIESAEVGLGFAALASEGATLGAAVVLADGRGRAALAFHQAAKPAPPSASETTSATGTIHDGAPLPGGL
jgi:hypothetical protein